jgi:hypothetical protein
MKNKKYVFVTLAATVAVSAAVILLMKRTQQRKRLTVISDEGYETAGDIKFPLKINRPQPQEPY